MSAVVRDMRADEAHHVVDYFLGCSPSDHERMGVDPARLPTRTAWEARLAADFRRPLSEREFFYVVWEVDGTAIGHSNLSNIVFGREAYMHLHIWREGLRRLGYGRPLVLQSLRRYFEAFQLEAVYSQPNAFNTAPNRTLFRAGFEFVDTRETVPGWMNNLQTVTRWVMRRGRLEELLRREFAPGVER